MRSGRLAALLVAGMLVASCSPSPSPSGSTSESPSITAAASAPPAAIPTSEELIAAALTSGAITYEQSLLYRALALFDSPGLPKEFHSAIPNMDAAGDLFGEIDAKESTLSAGLLTQLAPYRARPADPISIFNVPPKLAGVNAVLLADTVTTWKSLPAAGGAARVWVKDSADAQTQLTQHAADVTTVWAQYPGIFTYPMPDTPEVPSAAVNPDGAIDFYFVNASDLDPRRTECVATPSLAWCVRGTNAGFAQRAAPYPGNKSSAYLVVDAAASGDDLIDTIAHELAHASQFAYDQTEASWLKESTATWVAYKVVKKLGLTPGYSYRRLASFFAGLDKPLPRLDDLNAYGSWLYFLFASMEAGDGVVTDIWKEAAAEGVQGPMAVDKVFPFDKHFADFSVRNWNKDPVAPQYKSADSTFPSGYQPQTRNKVKTLDGGKEDALDVNLPPLASAYYEYVFPASTRVVTFENTLANIPNAHVWAMKNVNENWIRPEDWTTQAKPTFCRDNPQEDLAQIILVVSNTSLTNPLKVSQPPRVVAGATGCSGWSGTMKATESWAVTYGHGTATSTFAGLWKADAAGDAECPGPGATFDPSCVLFRPTGSISWTWDSHLTETGRTCDSTKAGTLDAGHELHPDMQVFYTRAVDTGHLQFYGRGSFILPAQDCYDPTSAGADPPMFFDLSKRSSSGTPAGGGNTCYATTWQIDTKGDTITGSCFEWNNSSTSLKFEWTLKRVGAAPGS
jgi:hypothetical protein